MSRKRISLQRKTATQRHKQNKSPSSMVSDDSDVTRMSSVLQAYPQRAQNQQTIMHLQRTIGNHAVQNLLQRNETDEVKTNSNEKDDSSTELKPPEDTMSVPDDKNFEDFDGKQYRVTGKAPNRKIEEVKRMTTVDGEVYYVALGEVINFMEKMPIVRYYKNPVDLGDWYPSVTHLNGMNVKTQDGITDAVLLQQNLNEQMDQAGDDVALGQDAIDVLYTYSSTEGFGWDLVDCVKGKLGFDDKVIHMQTQMILDAVLQGNLTYISAHSRGTIKTDNAVRNAFRKLQEHFRQEVIKDVAGSLDLEQGNVLKMWSVIKALAKTKAKEEMNKYVRLVYAGNAVVFPSSVLPIEFIVGYYDGVSMTVGSMTQAGVEKSIFGHGNDDSKMTHQWSGHGFRGYIKNVVKKIKGKIIKDNESDN